MSVDSKQMREVLADQLSDLDDSLGATVDDVQMLADIQQGIGRLLADDKEVESEIRQVLQERFEGGGLRKETYQLVKSMLDRYVTENVATTPGDITYDSIKPPKLNDPQQQPESPPQDGYTSTTVLADDSFKPVSADDQVQVGSVLRDRFLLQKRVSGGSMGVVYKALDRRLAEAGTDSPYVAIKVLSPQLARSGPALRALQQEAAKGRCLTHPNIVRFIDFDRDDELYFIVMEWLEGQTLAEILDASDGKDFDLEQTLDIVRQVGAALEFAHRCGIVHADVKPGNVMVTPDGSIKLFDFGVARVRQTQELASKDFDPAVLGALTPAYSSMQVLTGDEPVAADDVFSLACLMYRVAAGYRVFGPRNAAEAAAEGMTPQRIKALSESQWAALKKAISYSRVTRFESVAEFIAALDDDTEEHINIEPDDRFVAEQPTGSRLRMPLMLLLLLMIAAAGYQLDWLDKARSLLDQQIQTPISEPVEASALPVIDDLQTLDEADDAAQGPQFPVLGDSNADVVGSSIYDPNAIGSAVEANNLDAPGAPPVIDFSTLPPADVQVSLVQTGNGRKPVEIRLREDSAPVTVDLMRTGALELPLRLRLEEVAYSGNRSPWAAGQYALSSGAVIEIPAGQDRARVTLTMAGDPLREADQVSTLRVRQAESTRTQFAALEVILEDDDQRDFEARLPTNTIAFAVSQVSIRERDPAVQVDVLRFNPDAQPVVVGFAVRGITATEGEDYFSPSGYSISFGPRQRSARLLIPLVQDSIYEGDEAFTVELASKDEGLPNDVFQRIVVMIRDDESAGT